MMLISDFSFFPQNVQLLSLILFNGALFNGMVTVLSNMLQVIA